MFDPKIEIGSIVSDGDIYKIFGCQKQFGIRLNKKNKAIVIVTGVNDYQDYWVGDTLYYTGTNACSIDGNQTLKGPGNNNGALKAVWDNPESTTIFLFEQIATNQFVYRGIVTLASEPYQEPRKPDPNQSDPNQYSNQLVWKFPLKLAVADSNQSKTDFEYCESKAEKDLVKPAKGDIKMADFRKQIMEDIADYQERYPYIPHIENPEWAFNYWVLDKLFSVEEEVIKDQITDYNDKGVDCFVWHEDLHDLYIIQNKFFSDGTKITTDYVQNDFLTRPLGALEKGTYTRSDELQAIYTKFSSEDDFCLHFYLYVTSNNAVSKTVYDGVAKFNQDNAAKRIDARIFNLDEIKDLYYKEPVTDKKSFKFTMKTPNKGTELTVNNQEYKLSLALDAKYILAPVVTIYNLCKEALRQKYPLFDDNIREYLGPAGTVNKKIVATLNDPYDRSNFFFYNNGITMIVSDMSASYIQSTMRLCDVYDPQIVNGCQTVNTIYGTLSSLPEATLEDEFANTYVLVKILKIPPENEKLKVLYRNIVRYNNSQNAINEKAFTGIKDVFKTVQSNFEWKGFLVCIKQSDKHTFSNKYKSPANLLKNNAELLKKFNLAEKKKTKDFMIDLEKLLQVFLAFISTPHDAVQNKSKLLKEDSTQYKRLVEFITNTTINELLYLYLLYLRAEKEKQNSDDKKIPNPFYLIYCFSRYECNGDPSKISTILNSEDAINDIVNRYSLALEFYYDEWRELNPGREYNDMIKAAVKNELLNTTKGLADKAIAKAMKSMKY